MWAPKPRGKKRQSVAEASQLEKIMKDDDDIFGADIFNDIKGIVSVLHQIKEKAHKDGQKKNEETISRLKLFWVPDDNVAAEMKVKLDELMKSKIEKKDTIPKFEEDKERLIARYDQLRKREKAMLADYEKAWTDKIGKLEESSPSEGKTFNILRKTLGSFLDNASDEDFLTQD